MIECGKMTLIISYVSAAHAMLAVDRRVTLRHSGRVHDDISNKMILTVRSDAVVALAYTGLAYLNDKNMDSLIAEVIAGVEIDKYGMVYHPDSTIFDDVGRCLGRIGNSICQIMNKSLQRLSGNILQIVANGWQHKTNASRIAFRPFHFMLDFLIENGRANFVIHSIIERDFVYKLSPEVKSYIALNAYGSLAYMDRISPRLDQLSIAGNIKNAENIVVDSIRSVAELDRSIGDAVNVAVISPMSDSEYFLEANYHPSPKEAVANTGFTPWFVGHGVIVPPNMAEGGLAPVHLDGGNIRIKLDPGSSYFSNFEGSAFVAMGRQSRPGPPKK